MSAATRRGDLYPLNPDGLVGRSTDEVDTPVLLVDLDTFEANIEHLARYCRTHNTAWRPHAKAHKCPEIAHRQLAAGACGITCAKLSEAELMVRAGIGDILLANQLADGARQARLAALQKRGRVIGICDAAEAVAGLGRAARAAGVTVPVLVDVDIGLARTGASPGEPAVEVARAVDADGGLELLGLMGYEGHVLAITPPDAKIAACHSALDLLAHTRDLMRAAGLRADVVSAGGTGCFEITAAYQPVTELQAGGGIFMDAMYRDGFHVTEELGLALTCLTTVTSRQGDRAIVDAGFKTLSAFHHPPRPLGRDDLEFKYLSAEHGSFQVLPGSPGPSLGERLELLVGYSDSTIFMHDFLLGSRRGRVETVFEVAGRGLLV